MKQWKTIQKRRWRRSRRVRKRVQGSADRPRLSVFRSNRYIYAQIIDDVAGSTLVSSSSFILSKSGSISSGGTGNRGAAKEVGLDLAGKAKDKGIESVRFDRGPYKFHGRVQALAEGAREGGLVF